MSANHTQVVVWYKALFYALKIILLYAAIACFITIRSDDFVITRKIIKL